MLLTSRVLFASRVFSFRLRSAFNFVGGDVYECDSPVARHDGFVVTFSYARAINDPTVCLSHRLSDRQLRPLARFHAHDRAELLSDQHRSARSHHEHRTRSTETTRSVRCLQSRDGNCDDLDRPLRAKSAPPSNANWGGAPLLVVYLAISFVTFLAALVVMRVLRSRGQLQHGDR